VIKLLQVLSVMKCPAYSIMNIVGHTVQFLRLRTEEVRQKILQVLGQCWCLWSLILGGSTKSCRGHLGWMFVNFSVSLCHHLKQEQYYNQKCVIIVYNGTFEMASV